MKTKPFDVEEAKAGKPFHYIGIAKHRAIKYIGQRANGSGGHVSWAPAELLEMIVEPKVYKALLIETYTGEGPFVWTDTPENRKDLASRRGKILKEFEVEYDEV